MKFGFFILIFVLLSFVRHGYAQVDLSTEFLLGRKRQADPDKAGLESGRYQVRNKKAKDSKPPDSDGMTIVLKPTGKLPPKKVSTKSVDLPKGPSDPVVQLVFPIESETKVTVPVSTVAVPEKPQPITEPVEPLPAQEPNEVDKVKSALSGVPSSEIAEYIEQVHPDDQRLNKLEATVYTGLMSNESRSSYSYRSYTLSSPFFGFDGRLFLNPFLAVRLGHSFTLAGDVDGGVTPGSRLAAKYEQTEVAVDLRRYFGLSRRSTSLEYGVHYFSNVFTVSGDNSSRVGLKSSGLGFHLLSRFPVAPSYAWLLGARLAPRFNHQENSTGIALSSGEGQESTRFGILVGGEFKFSRTNVLEWKLTWTVDKHVYSGLANSVDQNTGQIPNGVGVTNNYGVFSLGYRWGQ